MVICIIFVAISPYGDVNQSYVMMNLNDFWDINGPDNNPVLTPDVLSVAKRSTHNKLPALIVQLLRIKNIGKIANPAFLINQMTCKGGRHLPINRLFGLTGQCLCVKTICRIVHIFQGNGSCPNPLATNKTIL